MSSLFDPSNKGQLWKSYILVRISYENHGQNHYKKNNIYTQKIFFEESIQKSFNISFLCTERETIRH